jgi:glucose-6-phosphate 1-dehydrogenase
MFQQNEPVAPHLFVVMGGTGDLMRRKLLPGLFFLSSKGFLEKSVILGVARDTDLNDEGFRTWAREALTEQRFSAEELGPWCDCCLHYQAVGGGSDGFESLAKRIEDIERAHGLPGNRTFYLALPPNAFPPTIRHLGEAGLNRSRGWTRIVVEKPFGRDLRSARELNQLVHEHFEESQVYRIDHYLGKETVQNLLVFRLANQIFESLWNRDRVDSVQITVAEDLGVGSRGRYYEQAGAIRDMVQNHLTQLLTLVAMEVPVVFEADAIRNEKVKVLQAITTPRLEDVVFGQYVRGALNGQGVAGYREEDHVAPGSRAETYAALRLEVDNWRWQGVPFYVRTAKRLARKSTEIAVIFRRPPVCFFQEHDPCDVESNVLRITLQPDEGFSLSFEMKAPGDPFSIRTQQLDFDFKEAYDALPEAYETLILDILQGDQTLFVRSDEVEASWNLFSPLLEEDMPISFYEAGTWGPREADHLLEREGRKWLNG